MPFDRRSLILPDGTEVQEHTIVLPAGDAVVSDSASLDFGIAAPGRVFVGERAELGGVRATGDVRVDLWSRLRGDVASEGNVYLGERVHVEGKLTVAHDLDVGNDVRLDKGFEARGWIHIRSPVPMVLYVFAYLLQLLGQGRGEEVDRILRELEDAEDATSLVVGDVFLYVPKGARLGLAETTLPGALSAGANCRLLGNHRVEGGARLGKATRLHGSLTAGGDVTLDDESEVHGDLTASGTVRLGDRARVHGHVRAAVVEMRPSALVDGMVHADAGVRFLTAEARTAREKVEDFEAGRQDLGRYF